MEEKDLQEKRGELLDKVKKIFFAKSESSENNSSEDNLNEQRKKFISSLKKNKNWLFILLLIIIIGIGIHIRVLNFPLLKDVTTGDWLSTDLDSHIYLKYAKVILDKGYLPDTDMSRFVPVGAPTANYAFPAYVIYFIYKVMHVFDPSTTIYYADVIYPVIAFVIGMIFFFLLTRKVFGNYVGLLGSFFLAIMPAFLQRTMGGSSDHDALGMMFMFLSMYLFLLAWQSKETKKALLFGSLAGIATGLTGLTWGAWKFLALIFALFVLLEYFFEKVEEKQIYLYALWLALSVIVMIGWVPLFPLKTLITSLTTALSLFVLVILLVDLLVFKKDWLKIKNRIPQKIPPAVACVAVSLLLGFVGLIVVLGPANITHQFTEAKSLLLHPMGKDRWELTVAEQRQPYFKDITNTFGPVLLGIPLVYFLFLVGTILAFYSLVRQNNDKVKLTAVYVSFLMLLLLSRYSSGSKYLNGTSMISIILYFGSFLALAVLFLYYFWKSYTKEKDTFHLFKRWDSGVLFLLVWVMFMVIAARGAVRLLFIFAPVAALFAAYAVVEMAKYALEAKKKAAKFAILILLLIVVLSPLAAPWQGIVPNYYKQSSLEGTYSGPPYNQPWQQVGAWVKQNVPKDAIFAHWWDYGYWVQNGFERASVLDGANKVKYWNYLMGRHVLSGRTQQEALEFLYAHNATNFLIVSEDIGKYTAYSSIGSDENYDRYSWINTFIMNQQGTQETRNTTVLMYQGSYVLDDDFVWNDKVYPRGGAGIGAVFLPVKQTQNKNGNETSVSVQIMQPTVALVQNGQRTDVPLQCVFLNGEMIKFQNSGMPGCLRILPTLDDKGNMQNPLGAGLFISQKGVNALWVNLYLLGQRNPDFDTSAFELIYGEEKSGIPLAIYRNQLIGPIKIWKINYPPGFSISEEMSQRYLGGNEYLPDYFFKVD